MHRLRVAANCIPQIVFFMEKKRERENKIIVIKICLKKWWPFV